MKRFSLSRWLSGKKPSKNRRNSWSTSGQPLEALETRVVPAVALLGTVEVAQNFPIIDFNGRAFFYGRDNSNQGYEPWISDGTAAGTFQISDIAAGPTSSLPSLPIGDQAANFRTLAATVGDRVFFAANNGSFGTELWVTDGTASGTRLVSNIYTDTSSVTPNSSNPRNLINVNGVLYFSATNGVNGREVWRSNGTAAGTRMVVDLAPGTQSGLSASTTYTGTWAALGDRLIFSGQTFTSSSVGLEPYVLDTTTGQASLLADIYAGISTSFPENFKVFLPPTPTSRGLVSFTAYNGTVGIELWLTDGTPGGTYLPRDVYPGIFDGADWNLNTFDNVNTTTVGSQLYFTGQDGTAGTELWGTDGTSLGTQLVADIRPGIFSGDPDYLVNVNGTLYFSAFTSSSFATRELFRLNGTTAVQLDSGLAGVDISGVRDIAGIGDFAVFAVDSTTGSQDRSREIWVSDGTTANTLPGNSTRDVNLIDPQDLKTVGNTVFMTVAGPTGQRYLARYRVSEPPTDLFLTPASVNEESAVGTEVGVLTPSDPDLPNDNHTYALAVGEGSQDNGFFRIVGDRVQVNARLDFETRSQYSIRVRVTDRGGNTFEKPFVITLNDVNETPTDLTLSPATVVEAQPVNSLVGNFTPIDGDSLSQSFVYTLVAGAGATDNALFTIPVAGNPDNFPLNQLRTNAVFDFEARSSYSIRVRVTNDDIGNPATPAVTFEKIFTIQVTNTNEAPLDITLTGNTVLEGQPEGTVVGVLTGLDPDAGDTLSFTVEATSAYPDGSQFRVVGNQLVTNEELDFEAGAIRNILIVAADGGGLTVSKAFQINLLNLDEFKTTIVLSNTEIDENSPGGTQVGTLTTTDPVYAATLSWSLSGGIGGEDNGRFQLVGNTLVVAPGAVLDFEAKNRFNIRIKATDSTSLAFEKRYVITIRDVNEAPGPLTLTNLSVPEAQQVGTPVGFLRAPDPEANDTVTFSLVPGAGSQDNASFSVFETSLRANVSFNFDVRRFYSVRVRASDQNGNSVEQTFEIRITQAPKVTPLYRLFSEALNYHFFTSSREEFENAIRIGYRDETRQLPGIQVLVRQLSGALPLYRLYNLENRRHYYTTSIDEANFLVGIVKPGNPGFGTTQGWRLEKIEGFIYGTAQPNTVEVFRLYNRNSGTHLFTESTAVRDAVLRAFPNEWFQHNSLGFAYQGVIPAAAATAQLAAAVPAPVVASAEAGIVAAPVAAANRLETLVAAPVAQAAAAAPVAAPATTETNDSVAPVFTNDIVSTNPLDFAFSSDLEALLN